MTLKPLTYGLMYAVIHVEQGEESQNERLVLCAIYTGRFLS